MTHAKEMASMRKATRAHRFETILRLSDESFAKHEIHKEGPGRWVCEGPDDSNYWFRVITAPGAVILYGDIGEMVLRCYGRDSLAWAKRVFAPENKQHPDYALGKVPSPLRNKEFCEGDAFSVLDEMRAEARQSYEDETLATQLKKIQSIEDQWLEDRDDTRSSKDAWSWAYYSVTEDCEVPSCMYWSNHMLWCWFALCWFGEHVVVDAN